MLVLVKALRPTVAGGGHQEPKSEFWLEEADAVSLESRGIVERVHEAKQTAPPENKMAEPPENKIEESKPIKESKPVTTESLKKRRRRRK